MAKPPTTTENTDITQVQDQLPAGYDISELEADAKSNPQLAASDVALPYVYVLQTNSPQVNPAKADFIAGATAGMFYNSVLDRVYDGRTQGLMVIPCAYERRLVEWVHRDVGGGWVADYPVDSDIMKHTTKDEKGKPRLPNGNVIVETAYHYLLAQDPEDGAWFQGVTPFSSTFLKKNRKWNNLITTSKIPGTDTQAPRFLYAYHLTTEIESKGENSWFVPEMKKVESPIQLELYRHAKKFAQLVNGGQVSRVTEVVSPETIDPETGEII
jgi:hypothetical protein